MSDSPSPATTSTSPVWTSLPVHRPTLQRIKHLKHGGESYDDLLRKMVDQYDPTEGLEEGEL